MSGIALLSPTGELRTFPTGMEIGRHPACELCLDDSTVSSRHAMIEWRGARWRLRDLRSRHGTSVNGRRVATAVPLSVDDELRFAGGPPWIVRALDPPPAEASPLTTDGGPPPPPPDVVLLLTWDGSEEGIIEVGGIDGARCRAALPFVLLHKLAEAPGDWVEDADLRMALWGRRSRDITRNALHVLLTETRGLLLRLGLPPSVIEKQQGRTRIVIPCRR